MAEELTRARRELMAPYEHPYRYAAVETWRCRRDLRRATALAVVLWLGGAVGVAVGEELLGLIVGLGWTMGAVIVVLWLVAILRAGWRLTRGWNQKSELATVRARRPQAGSEDPDLAHDEFAVTVEEDGRLVAWRFRPLFVAERPAAFEIEVPGRPRYAASRCDATSFDVHDTVRASEQLVMAQTEAAECEAASAGAAHEALDAEHAYAELAAEARTTAAALQRTTGQRSRRD
jgi:hypothetical protein